jgi:hypothetical protein
VLLEEVVNMILADELLALVAVGIIVVAFLAVRHCITSGEAEED